MKKLNCWLLLAALGFLPACAFNDTRLAIQPLGPPPAGPTTASVQGSLVVYSAWSPFNNDLSIDHSGYSILSTGGKLVRNVHNYIVGDYSVEPPTRVSLPPGKYTVKAVSQDYGGVLVPVVIKSGETTSVYLDCASQPADLRTAPVNTVKLPDGEVIGWAANQPGK